ncbi:MAG: cellulase family glycosylhydrolase [Pirellulales bacterium]|nr:cellulase family glycosylhydrolase [Pirellulales bacterium]
MIRFNKGRLSLSSVQLLTLLMLPLWFTRIASAADAVPHMPGLPRVRVAADGRTFETEDGQPFVPMGVNYFRPHTGWAPQLWKQFDAEATRQDFHRMKELGVNCVRVFLTYGSFFTEPDALNSEGLAKFDQFLKMAEEAGIYVHPTGPDHWEGLPAWARTDRIADERVLDALERFWTLFAERYCGRTVLFAYDLLNEPCVSWDTPPMRSKWNKWLDETYGSAAETAKAWGMSRQEIQWGEEVPPPKDDALGNQRLLDYQRFREQIADTWTRRQTAAIKQADPSALVTVGMIQWSVPALLPGSVSHYAAFRPQRQAQLVDFMEVHFYPLATGFYEYKDREDELRNLAYLESVVGEVAKTGKPVVVAEFGWYGGGPLTIGGGHPHASEEDQARWCRCAVEVTQGLAAGWLNWGFYDTPEARDVSQRTGMLTADGQMKAWGHQFKDLSRNLAGQHLPAAELGPRPVLDWQEVITSAKAAEEFREHYFQAFRRDQDSQE